MMPCFLVLALALLAASPVRAEDSPAEPPAAVDLPPPELPPELPAAPKRRRFRDLPQWPGRFIGLRAGASGGSVSLPRFGLGADASKASTWMDASPQVGAEFGYAEKHWGAAVTAEWAPLSLTGAEFLASGPQHWSVGVQLLYIPNQRIRWIFGIDPYVAYRTEFASGQWATSRGYAVRVGAHLRLSDVYDGEGEPETLVWEAFAHASGARFLDIDAGAAGSSRSYSRDDLLSSGEFIGAYTGAIGIQLDFRL